MSSAISGFGTLVIWNYHRILEMLSIGGPSESRDVIDVTSHDSANSYREFVAGLASGGDISIEGNLITTDTDGQVAFYTDLQAGAERAAWIVMPMDVGASMSFQALPKAFAPSHPHEGKIGISATLGVEGKPTLYTTQSTGISGLTGIEQNGETALSISPSIAAGTYEYTCTVNTASTWVKLTVTAASHTIKVQGATQTSGVQGDAITLNAAGEDTEIFIMVYETSKSPRLYVLTVTRPAA